MGNDMQFAQDDPGDPILAKIYGTVDAYFGSYQELEQMLTKQRQLNLNTSAGLRRVWPRRRRSDGANYAGPGNRLPR